MGANAQQNQDKLDAYIKQIVELSRFKKRYMKVIKDYVDDLERKSRGFINGLNGVRASLREATPQADRIVTAIENLKVVRKELEREVTRIGPIIKWIKDKADPQLLHDLKSADALEKRLDLK